MTSFDMPHVRCLQLNLPLICELYVIVLAYTLETVLAYDFLVAFTVYYFTIHSFFSIVCRFFLSGKQFTFSTNVMSVIPLVCLRHRKFEMRKQCIILQQAY